MGKNQTDFAAIAGASKRAMVSWEKGESAPLSTALISWAEAGADAVYILTGRRLPDPPVTLTAALEEQLNEIHREILASADNIDRAGGGEGIFELKANQLSSMLAHEKEFMTPAMIERASSLLDIALDRDKLALFLAADRKQMRKRREEMKKHIAIYLDDSLYEPVDAVRDELVMVALEYGVPVGVLADLTYAIGIDITDRLARGEAIGTPDGE